MRYNERDAHLKRGRDVLSWNELFRKTPRQPRRVLLETHIPSAHVRGVLPYNAFATKHCAHLLPYNL